MIHCGFVGLVGLPNTGKSTLLNEILGEKVSIISQKPQTTRQSFTGVTSNADYQLILLDAPGFVESKPGLFEFLHTEFSKVLEKAEHLIVLVSHDQKEAGSFVDMMKVIKDSKKPVSYLFTKSDLPATDWFKEFQKSVTAEGGHAASFSVKNQDKENLSSFLKTLSETLPQEHHPLYDPDLISLDRTRDIVAEFIREQCFLQLDKELPFGLGVIIKSFKKEKGLQRIEANIIVEKENHKGMVIGKGGARLKKIGQEARKKIEELLGEKVFLGLHVAHKKNWMRNKSIMKEAGYHHDQ